MRDPHESEFRTNLDAETGRLAYEEALHVQGSSADWADAIDRKVVSIFSVSAVIMAVAPALKHAPRLTPGWWAFLAALLLWAAVGYCCIRAFQLRPLQVLNPGRLAEPDWREITAAEFRYYRVQYVGQLFDSNCRVLEDKAHWLKRGIWLSAIEVGLIGLALMLTP